MEEVVNNIKNISIPEDVQNRILEECKKYKLKTCYNDNDIMYIGKNFFTDLIDTRNIVIYLLGRLENDTITLAGPIDLLYDEKDLDDFSIGSMLKYNQEGRRNYLCLNCYDCEGCTRCNRCFSLKCCNNCSLCYACIECNECSNCHICTRCDTCKYCTDCLRCLNCYGEECDSCEMMNGMKMCSGCIKCINCKKCCKTCIECDNCSSCTGCIGCINCTDCTNCTSCINCTDINSYDRGIDKSGSKNVDSNGIIKKELM